jgi:hypothetical protein
VGLVRGIDGTFISGPATQRRTLMGKYVLGWMLGVPVIVLVIIYIFMH